MNILHTHCAGLDVHKKTVVASRIWLDATGEEQQQTRTFATMTTDLLALSDWLADAKITHVAMESTGDYWKPVYNILEGQFELLVVNSQHVKMVPGRKTDANDAQWLAQLLQHGLLRASFVPPAPQRELRELTRYRSSFIAERATLSNRVQKLLESANIKLSSVATNVLGVSGRSMLDAIIGGEADPTILANMAQGRMKSKQELLQKALDGRVKATHRLILSELLTQIDSLEASIGRLDKAIEEACAPFAEAVAHLDTIPGVATATAQLIVSEVGTDMSRFPTPGHLAAWAGVAPGNNQSGGKRLSGRSRQGNRLLKVGLVQAAQAASHTRNTYLAAQYHRLAARRGKKKAILAVAHSILVIAYRLIERGEDYKDLGANYFEQRKPEAAVRRLTNRLAELGYDVTLNPKQVPLAA
jgi:transposase